jgi:hypothetical protein
MSRTRRHISESAQPKRPDDGNFTDLDNVLAVKNGKLRMTLAPEQVVIVSAKTTNPTNPTIAPWMRL